MFEKLKLESSVWIPKYGFQESGSFRKKEHAVDDKNCVHRGNTV